MKLRSAAIALLFVASAAQAADCVSSSQQVSDYFTSINRAAGAIAFNGSFLGMARNESAPPRSIWFAAFDQNLNQIINDLPAAPASRNATSAFFWNGSGFGLFFIDTGGELRLQRFTPTGDSIGSAGIVGRFANFPDQEFGFAFDPVRNAYIVVHTISQGADVGFWMTIVGTDGVTRSDERLTFTSSPVAEPRVAVAADGTIGIVRHQVEANGGLRFTAIDRNNNVVGFADISSNAQGPIIASDGSGFAIVYQSAIAGGSEIRWARVDAKARIVAAESRLVSGRGVDVAPTSLIWNRDRNEWALAYVDSPVGFQEFPGEYRLRLLSAAGALLSDTVFSPEPSRNVYSTQYPIVWTGSAYISTGERFTPGKGTVSFLFKHCPLASEAIVDRVTVPATLPVRFTAKATGGTAPYTHVWDFGDFSEPRKEETLEHTFQKPGTYTVTLTTTDAAGATSVVKRTVTVYFPKRRAR